MGIDFAVWRQFARDQSPAFPDLVVIERLLSEPEQIIMLIDDAIRTATSKMHHDLRIRGFRQGILDYRLTEALTRTPSADDTATEWLARVARDRAACVTVSDLAAWSLDLADSVRSLLEVLLEKGNYQLLSGMDAYTFIADAGWTPFGIHKDAEPTFIVHLGPACKEVLVWPSDAIDAQLLTRNPYYGQLAFNFDDHLSSAYHHILRPGDFICIPTDRFHLFRNLGPSAFLGLSLYPTDNAIDFRKVATQTFWDVIKDSFKADGLIASAGSMSATMGAALRHFSTTEALADSMSRAIHRAELMRRTYGYACRPHSSALPSGPAPAGVPFRWAYGGVIAVPDRPPAAAGTELLARGRSIAFAAPLDFGDLILQSGSSQPLSRDEISDAMPSRLNGQERAELIETLYRYGALRPDGPSPAP